MKLSKNLGMTLLSLWMLASGLMSLLNFSFPSADLIMAILATVAGALILWNLRGPKRSRSIGVALLGVWLILEGVAPFLNISFSGLNVLMALLAIVAGGLILLGR